MCYFLDSPVVEVHEDVPEDNPIFGYKVVRWRDKYTAGYLRKSLEVEIFSTVMYAKWENGRMSAKRKISPSQFAVAGIYVYKDRPRIFGIHSLVVKVAMWGRVVEHGESDDAEPGYRAQHAKIVTVYDLPPEVKVKLPGARIYRRKPGR